MSYFFEINQRTVWNPARGTGQVYVGFVQTVERVFLLSSGLKPVGGDTDTTDMFDIDAEQFIAFVVRLLEISNDGGMLSRELEAVIVPGIVMLTRAGFEAVTENIPDRIRDEVVALRGSMPD